MVSSFGGKCQTRAPPATRRPGPCLRVPMLASHAIVAIPAKDEAGHIGACLSALASQRDQAGRHLTTDTFAVVLLVNNSTDSTAAQAIELAPQLGFALHVVVIDLPPSDANAGGARRRAMT